MAMANQKQSLEVLEAEAQIWNQVYNYINSMSLKCATELGIPDVIHKHGGPMTLLELVDALPAVDKAKANCMYRLMRILVHSGFFVIEKINSSNEEGYSLTPASRLLVGDCPMSMKPFVISQIDPVLTEPMHHLKRNPRFSHLFDQGMESDTPMVAEVITRDCRQVFDGLDSLVDVGGGTGTLAKAIAEAFPQIHCTVLDLAPIVAGLEGRRNLKYIEGNMFEYIPPADAVVLKWVLHDWSDEESVEILKKCKEAITRNGKRGKVIIIEMVVDESESVETQLLLDMLMMALATGRERKEKEWANLISDAGFSGYRIYPVLGLRSIIESRPLPSGPHLTHSSPDSRLCSQSSPHHQAAERVKVPQLFVDRRESSPSLVVGHLESSPQLSSPSLLTSRHPPISFSPNISSKTLAPNQLRLPSTSDEEDDCCCRHSKLSQARARTENCRIFSTLHLVLKRGTFSNFATKDWDTSVAVKDGDEHGGCCLSFILFLFFNVKQNEMVVPEQTSDTEIVLEMHASTKEKQQTDDIETNIDVTAEKILLQKRLKVHFCHHLRKSKELNKLK
ncbi:putative O-methyltransferase 3 [Sesamum angolense]|uniref:O-methyltransferase 3 n=1 Tax=Sesamum angolense TaxID=2727404 RepID=A0AAE2C2G7_9LAMI|nr:putative O-methyltransferase 3 [Sesamum angolense]